MNAIFGKLLSIMGWKKLMLMVWAVAYKELAKRAADTQDVEWDDDLVSFMDQVVKTIAA